MRMEVRFLVEALRAICIRADEWLFTGVDPHMCFKIEIERESFVTKITFVWFFTLKKLKLPKLMIYLLYEQACAF